MSNKIAVILIIFFIIPLIGLLIYAMIFAPKINDVITTEMTDTSFKDSYVPYGKIIDDYHNQPTYSISIPLIASPTVSYNGDYMIITYNNLHPFENQTLTPSDGEK